MSENPPPGPPPEPPPDQPPYPQGPPPPGAMSPQDERLWATLAHVGSFVSAWVALGLFAPLIVLLVFGGRSAYVRHHAVESLNFQITALIALTVSAVLVLLVIGFLLLPLVGLLYVVLVIVASVKANHGEWYRYPVNLRLVH